VKESTKETLASLGKGTLGVLVMLGAAAISVAAEEAIPERKLDDRNPSAIKLSDNDLNQIARALRIRQSSFNEADRVRLLNMAFTDYESTSYNAGAIPELLLKAVKRESPLLFKSICVDVRRDLESDWMIEAYDFMWRYDENARASIMKHMKGMVY